MKSRLYFCVVFIAVASSAFAWYGPKNLSAGFSLPKKDPAWPGHYTCEQCIPSTSPGQDCSHYEIEIDEREKEGEFRAQGSADYSLKANLLLDTTVETMDFHYVESAENSAPPVQLSKDAILFSLQRRGDDYILRFRAIPSKIPNQNAIPCQQQQ